MKNTQKGPLIISGNAHNNLAIDIANYIGQDLTKAEIFKFNNDNTFVKILENVRERDVFIIQPNKDNFKAPNLVSVLENEKILKIGHFLRFDKSALEFFLKCKMKNIFDTKIASKIVRTYTDSHGLKNLVQEFCNKSLDKRQGSSDWNKDINELTDKQLEYAANDVIYLHKIKNELEKMLIREKRMDIFKNCLAFLDTRVELDLMGWENTDIFAHK